jgi:hypothetical protein
LRRFARQAIAAIERPSFPARGYPLLAVLAAQVASEGDMPELTAGGGLAAAIRQRIAGGKGESYNDYAAAERAAGRTPVASDDWLRE